MSSHSQKNQKMCKSPSKSMSVQKTTKISEMGSYEQLSTNCTMVGSNNLNLDTKINYITPQIKVCTKPMKTSEIVKKPQSPRSMEAFIHNSLVTNAKFQTTNNFNHVRQQVAISGTSYNKFENVTSFQQRLPVNKSPVPSFTTMSNAGNVQSNTSMNNGGNMCNMSPSAYSNPSPSYPNNSVSPYSVQISSPANSISSISSGIAGIKSPVASPQNIRPPTPQPILPQAFQQIPVMTSGPNLVQIIHAPNTSPAYQNHPMLARQTILAQQQNVPSSTPVIKIKPPLNILPKPPTTTTPSKTVNRTPSQPAPIQSSPSQQIVLPNQTILPTAQTAGTLVLNQMPLIVQQNTAQGVQLILRPGTPNSGQIAGKLQQQNLILQQGPTQQPTVLIQHGNRSQTIQQPQQLVRVLTANGMIQGLAPTYIAMNNQQLNIQQLQAQPAPQQQNPQSQTQQIKSQVNLPQGIINACLPATVTSVVTNSIPSVAPVTSSIEQLPPPKRKPKKKKKNKEPKLDLANIMKLSGIGDDDDIHFESDTSDSALTSENQTSHHHLQKTQRAEVISAPTTPEMESHINFPKRIGNIHISAVTQDISKISQNTTQTNAILEKHFMQTSQISVQQSLSDINAINQNLTQIGILNQNSTQNFLNNITGNSVQTSQPNLLNQDSQNLANFLQALNQNQTFLNGQSISQSVIPVSSMPGLTTFTSSSQPATLTSTYQKFTVPTQTTNANFGPNLVSNSPNLTSVSESILNIPKIASFTQTQTSRPNQNTGHILTTQTIQGISQNTQSSTILSSQIQNLNQNVSGLTNAHFNISNPLSNIQVQNFGNQNLFLNQGTNTIIAPNIPNFSGNITINNGLIPNTNLTLPNNIVPNFLPTNLVQQQTEPTFAGNNMQRTGGFKLALSEDGRLILQHDPNLNQDIQSQLLLQSIFGINIPGNNLVLSSVNNQNVQQQAPQQAPQIHHTAPIQQHNKPIAVVEPKKQEVSSTKTTNIIQNSISSIRSEQETTPQQTNPTNNFSYIVNLTPEQLETLKRNGQLTVNGQTIFMHRPKNQENDKVKSSPKTKTIKKKPQFENKNIKTTLHDHLNKCLEKTVTSVATQSSNSSLISALQSPAKNILMPQINPVILSNQMNIESKTTQEFENFPQNVVCVQPNNSKILNPDIKMEMNKKTVMKKTDISRHDVKNHEFVEKIQILEKDKKISDTENGVNVEQFLNNLNINPANLGQLISQKLPGGVDHKIVNISQGPTAGHIVAKIDISSENMKQILSQPVENTQPSLGNNIVLPPLVSMKTETPENVFNAPIPSENIINQQPVVLANAHPAITNEIPSTIATIEGHSNVTANRTNNTVYQRIQTIQLTPQKQQLLRSVQLQIQTLTARLQHKNEKGESSKGDGASMPDTEIHRTLKLLFVEQQKILATGKVIPTHQPPVGTISSNVDSVSTQTVPVTTPSKNNNTFLTSLLQQPVVNNLVSHNQKVYYHHGNQIITINSNLHQNSQNTHTTQSTTQNPGAIKVKKLPIANQPPTPSNVTFLTPTKIEKGLQISTPNQDIKPNIMVQNTTLLSPKKIQKPLYSKAQLIEQQMTTDQNGAINPDITTPFASKADASKRLVRYHCYNQPVLSQKDLDKADEIFELTARHFIEKFKVMVNKYKYLLLKESMREVQTSELMMIDRMFLAEEQQSLLKAQSDLKMQNEMDMQRNIESSLQEMYSETPDEDIKPDLLPLTLERGKSIPQDKNYRETFPKTEDITVKTETEKSEFDENPDFNIKCGLNYFSEDSCDSSGNFQVYEGSPKFEEFVNKSDNFNTSEKKDQKNNHESYNTTKIIGNFEIEINNKGCNNQESYTKNFRQKIIDNKDINVHSHIKSNERKDENFEKHSSEQNDDYDEWLCIQRELGYFPENKETEKVPEGEHNSDFKSKGEPDSSFKKSHKRSSTDSNRLETLKKFRVEKHNSKVKKTGSIIGEVKFEVRIEHKKVFPENKKDADFKQNSSKRNFDYTKEGEHITNKRMCNPQNFKDFNPGFNIKMEDNQSENVEDIFDRSIDEQVQSAIDSILNLQQITSMGTEKGESSKEKSSEYGTKTGEDGNDSTLALDEAVKSILS